jgi:cobalt-zinc-cadmium efflux system protein
MAHDHALGAPAHKHAHSHAHDHDHDHAHAHDHHHGGDEHNASRIGIAALLTGGFMVVEFGGGIVSGSLALLADAGHMLSDFGALALAWIGFRMARRPATLQRTFGFRRFPVLAAFVNGRTNISWWSRVDKYWELMLSEQHTSVSCCYNRFG